MAELASQAQVLLDERGSEDLIRLMADDSGFAIAPFLRLSRERAINALRTWFRQYRGQAPSEAFTLSLIDQIKVDQPSSRTELLHGEERFMVRQGRLVAAPVRARAKRPAPQSLSWSGQTTVELPEWGGRIRFDAESSCGLSAAWLRTVTLTVRARAGGERLRLARGRPSRTLKNLYQESGIPPEERRHLPLLYVGDSLLWAAGLGADVATAPSDERPGVTLVWESTTASR
jgi:tRNA(Ile)-lysidine synthase